MARLARAYVPGVAQHLVQHAAQGRTLFVDETDYREGVALVADCARASQLAIHAYVLLPREIRVVGTPGHATSTSRFFQGIGRTLVPRANRRDARSGALWARRYHATLIEADAWLMDAMRFVEQRPLGDGHVVAAADWRWSSAAHHVGHVVDDLVIDHRGYWALSDTPFARQATYRAWLETTLAPAESDRLQKALDQGWALGGDRFVKAAEIVSGRRLVPRSAGRPKTTGLSPINRRLSA